MVRKEEQREGGGDGERERDRGREKVLPVGLLDLPLFT